LLCLRIRRFQQRIQLFCLLPFVYHPFILV